MDIGIFLNALENRGIGFFAGVPDSLLGAFCDEIVRRHGSGSASHVVAHNEGGAVALAGGHYLATGSIPCVYMQNSGIGNALNPVVSFAHPKVYGVPMLFIVGWRGEPGTKDEPQHRFQGEATLQLLADIDINCFILEKDTPIQQLEDALERFMLLFQQGKSAAFVACKDAFSGNAYTYRNDFKLNREQAIGTVLEASGNDVVVSTTGKISRELFELREQRSEGHEKDFLTVGSMGHCSMIAIGIALNQPKRRVWCLDGDGSVLMHMGCLGVVGSLAPGNFIHVAFNNAAHETVGGMPTVADNMDFPAIALACGYRHAYLAADEQSLKESLKEAMRHNGPVFVEVRVALGSRPDLGRPTTEAQENKREFMGFIKRMKAGQEGL